MSHIMLNI